MAKHKLKQKKLAKGKQFWVMDFLHVLEGYVPASHLDEDRTGWCGPCGHPWAWHDNVWLKYDQDGKVIYGEIRCRGAHFAGLTPVVCRCRAEYEYSEFKPLTFNGRRLGLETLR